MRSLPLVKTSLGVCLSLEAFAQGPAPKEVEIVNAPLLVAAVPPARFQLVGFTPGTHPSDAGVLGLTLACQAQFLESRMCSSIEVLETVDVPSLAGSPAWVRPTLVPGTDTSHNDVSATADGPGFLSCVGWFIGPSNSGASDRGLTVSPEGRFCPMSCSVERPVACCAPVP